MKKKTDMQEEANHIRERMAKESVDRIIKELQAIPDTELLNAVSRHIRIKIKIKLF